MNLYYVCLFVCAHEWETVRVNIIYVYILISQRFLHILRNIFSTLLEFNKLEKNVYFLSQDCLIFIEMSIQKKKNNIQEHF